MSLSQPIVQRKSHLKMLKIVELSDEKNLKSSCDLVVLIAKVGELKNTSKSSQDTSRAREIFVYDDSYAVVKLITRNIHAENCASYCANQIIFLRNVKPMLLQNYLVLTTMADTLITVETNTPEAESLRNWFMHSSLGAQFHSEIFKNLSVDPKDSMVTLSSLLPNKALVSSPTIVVEKLMSNVLMNNVDTKGKEFNNRKSGQSMNNGEPAQKKMRTNPVDVPNSLEVSNIHEISRSLVIPEQNGSTASNSPSMQPTSAEQQLSKWDGNNIVVIDLSDDDETMKKLPNYIEENDNRETKQLTEEESIIEIADDTFSSLMTYQKLEEWTEEKDKLLINFISKNRQCLQNLKAFEVLVENETFQNQTVESLRLRVHLLAKVENYFYLMLLCGGKNIKTEGEKVGFITTVENLRKQMKISVKGERS